MLAGFAGLDPVLPGELQGGLDRFRAAGEEIELVELARKRGGELPGELLHRAVGERGGRDVAELARLARQRLRDLRIRVAEIRGVGDAHGVEVALPLLVVQPAALTPHDARVAAAELAVEAVAIGIAVVRHSSPFPVVRVRGKLCGGLYIGEGAPYLCPPTSPVGAHMPKLSCLLLTAALFVPRLALAQSEVVTPNDNLVTYGLPPMPAAIAAAARPYSEFRSAAFWDWHPTRREMIIGTRFGDAQQLHRVRSPGGDRTQLTFFPDPVSGASYQPTDGRYIVFTKDVGGAEFFQKYRYDVATGETTLLTDGKSRNVGGAWSHKGDRYAYMSTRRNGRDLDLWAVDPGNPPSDRMVAQLEGGGWGASDWSPDDKTLLLMEYVSVNESYLWLVDVASGEKTLLTSKGEGAKVAYGSATFAFDGKGIYVTTDRESEFQRLAYFELATRRHRYLTSRIASDG